MQVDAGEVAIDAPDRKERGLLDTVPLVKDAYKELRSRAKTINFAVAYGKTRQVRGGW